MSGNVLKVKIIRVEKNNEEGMIIKVNKSKDEYLRLMKEICTEMESKLLDFPIQRPWWLERKCKYCYQFFRNSGGREQWCIRHKTAIKIYSLPAFPKITGFEVKRSGNDIIFNINMGRNNYAIKWNKKQITIIINNKLAFKYKFTYDTFPYLSEYQVITDGLIDTLREIEWYLTEKEDVEVIEENGKTSILYPKWVKKLFGD